jgi:APA family basic amino acid/polyamine antiporter
MLLFLAVYMFNYSPTAWVVTVVWIAVGLFIYKTYASKREIEHVRKVKSLERLEKKEYRILVPLANKRSVEGLSKVAEAIAKKNNAEIIFLHVNEVSEGEKLLAGTAETARAYELFEIAESIVEKSNIPFRSIFNVSHRISQGIINTASEEECNFIVVGREKKPNFTERFFSSIIDSVISKAPSEIAVLHGEIPAQGIKKILIPFGHDIHTMLATEIAPAFIDYFNCQVKIVMVFEPGTPMSERAERESKVKELISENSLNAELKILNDVDILWGIIKEASDSDLVLMGGRSGDFLELLFGRSLAQEITEQSPCPVLWVKEYEERESFWKLLLKPLDKIGVENG